VLTVRSPSEAPRLSAPQQVVALAGQTLSLALQASDLDQDPLRWSAEGLPPGAELSAGAAYGQATLSWTPTADDLGRHDLELVVTDSGLPPRDAGYALPEQPEPNVTRHRLRVVVRADNRAPEVLGFTVDGQTVADHGGTLAIDAREGVPLTLEVFGRDADADPITWQSTVCRAACRRPPTATAWRSPGRPTSLPRRRATPAPPGSGASPSPAATARRAPRATSSSRSPTSTRHRACCRCRSKR
jgi:hypothetical protein